MKGKSLFILLGAAVMASCSGNKGTQSTDTVNTEEILTNTVELRGQWRLENIVFDDTTYVRPAEQTPDVRQYITFQDSTFSIQTNCNTIQGEYRISGDSISFPVSLMTEMACENMAVEDALRKILPGIATVDVQNDSVARLCGRTPSEYIMLIKATETAKTAE